MERTIIEGNLIQVKKDTVSVGAQAFLWSNGFWGGETKLLESNYQWLWNLQGTSKT